jgi:hypothetical protein
VFGGVESLRFAHTAPRNKVFALVKEALQTLGEVHIHSRGAIDLHPDESLETALTKTTIKGDIHDSGAEYIVTVEYDSGLSGLAWGILLVGIPCMLLGLLVLAAPLMGSRRVSQAVGQALSDLAKCLS